MYSASRDVVDDARIPRGLSWTGRAITSSVHAGLALTTYDEQKKRLLTKYDQQITWHSNMALATIDNYNHYYNSASLQPIGSRATIYHLQLDCGCSESL